MHRVAGRTRAIGVCLHRLAVAWVLYGALGVAPAFSVVKSVEFGNYNAVANIPIGFNFSYYGKSLDRVVINRYGVLSIESNQYAHEYNNYPLPYRYSGLYVFWDYLRASQGIPKGGVYYETQGVAPHRQFIVQLSHFNAGLGARPIGDFQVILDEQSNSIKYQYRNPQGSATVGRDATIGIQGPNQQFIQIGYHDEYVVDDQQAILFTPIRDTLDYRVDKQADFSFIDLTLAAPPTGHFLLPQGKEVVGDQVAIEVETETDDLQQIVSVDFFINEQWLARQSAAPWRTTWSTTTYRQGQHSLTAVITNRDNRTTTLTKAVQLTKVIPNNRPSYFAEITGLSPSVAWQSGQSITIEGRARTVDGKLPAKQQPLILHLRRNEQTRSFPLTSDAVGNFHTSFVPKFSDYGEWQVAVTHPDDKAVRFQPGKAFRVEPLLLSSIEQDVTVSDSEPLVITSEVTAATAVKGLRWVLRAEDQPSERLPSGVSLGKTSAIDIAAGKQAALTTELTILPSAGRRGQVTLTALSPLSASHSRGQLRINWQRVPDKAQLGFTPQRLAIGLKRGSLHTETLQLTNLGSRPAEQLGLALVDEQGQPAPDWIFFSSPTALGALAQGQSRLVELTAQPPMSVNEGDYRFRVLVKGEQQVEISLPVQLAISQQGQSQLSFHLSDIYTATRDEGGKVISGINGAAIVLQNEAVLSQIWTLTSNEQGEATVKGLPPGTYLWRISADRHQSRQGRIVVAPGENQQSVFLDYQTITVDFEVKPTTIKDRYDIELNTTFRTDVPAPVVIISPAAINLAGLAPGSEQRGQLTLSNHGLIAAENIQIKLPTSDARFSYHFTQTLPKTLSPGEQLTLDYQVIARPLQLFRTQPLPRSQTLGSASCAGYQAPVAVGWQSLCASGQTVAQQSHALFYALTGTDCHLGARELFGAGGGNYLGWLPAGSTILTSGCAADCDSTCCHPQGKMAGDR
ncbi:hypothetical protein HGT71_12115 [Rosenbergiella epipactidis]|uniref:Ig-like domain-containing protein n=1 Tax=Rosenbergiella epipactidis TaxID=1544694 RepID=UPI001BDA62D8|nr:Ig-like domain-containing protein [Rosenbergiella epipactidis]MBT0718991.1 hypothetical protein [Rosenbergiella epipactidis]